VKVENLFDSVEQVQGSFATAGRDRAARLRDDRVGRDLARIAAALGAAIRDERRRRHISMRAVAASAGVGLGTVQAAEAGRVCALETYARLADAIKLRAEFELVDPRRREPIARRDVDPVHAAMGDAEAAHMRGLGYRAGINEPFQHYQFAGRADVVAWSIERRALLHIENKTRFPDLQEAFGSFNAKRSYLGPDLAERAGEPTQQASQASARTRSVPSMLGGVKRRRRPGASRSSSCSTRWPADAEIDGCG
jgi:transcriptional regulator with XRE-family HTH domain